MQTELLSLISDACTAEAADVVGRRERNCAGVVAELQQQLDGVIEEYAKRDNMEEQSYRELLRAVSSACASALGILSACDMESLTATLPAHVSEETRSVHTQACS